MYFIVYEKKETLVKKDNNETGVDGNLEFPLAAHLRREQAGGAGGVEPNQSQRNQGRLLRRRRRIEATIWDWEPQSLLLPQMIQKSYRDCGYDD